MPFSVTLPHEFHDGPGNTASGEQVMDNLNALIAAINTASADWGGGGGGGSFVAGMMMYWTKGTVPAGGWVYCSGQPLATADYPDLFAAIAYAFGGSGATFNVPHSHQRFLLGAGGLPMATTGGAETVTLALNEIPKHRHTMPRSTSFGALGFTNYVTNAAPADNALQTDYSLNDSVGSPVGGGAAHNNMPPYLTIPVIIKT